MKRAALLLLPFAAACGDQPDSGYAVTAGGARQERYVAIPAGSVPRGTSERLTDIAAPGPPVTPASISAGATAYRGYCAPCHGVSGQGAGPVVEKGFPRPPPLSARPHSAEEIVAIISAGKGEMPSLSAQVPPERRWAIAYYLTREGGVGD